MDQQHQNFESFNDFSFVNAFSGTVENNPYAASAAVINNQANSSSLYDLSNPQYVQYENNQPSVQEACSQDTVTFDPSQNSMMKALGVVRKDLSNNKKRKRIVVLNDDDSDEDANSNLKKEIFDNSNTNQNQDEQDKNDASESDVQTTDNEEEGENLTDIGALKAKFLLKNAVIIQGPDKKKKKSRLLDSDDENQMQTTSVDVDDIGVVNEDENNEEELFEENILITEAIAAPITASVESFQEENKIEESNSAPLTAAIEEEIQEKVVEEKEEIHSVANLESKIPPIPCEQNETPKISDETSKAQSNEETEIDPSMSVEAILENIKPMADDDEFFKFDKSSDENDKTIPNDEYFGTPDKQQQGQYKGKKRGPKPGSKRTPRDTSLSSTQQRKKRGDRYEEDFVDDSDESGSDSNFSDSSTSTSDSSEEDHERTEKRPRGRPPSIKKSIAPVLIQSKKFTVTKVPIRNNIIKRDRFYDRSRDIPNDVYFGDVNVPLHVLHTRWNSDADSDDDWRCTSSAQSHRNMTSSVPSSSKMYKHLRPQFTYIHDHTEEPKLSSLKEFIHLCGIKVNYQRLFDGIKSSDQKCAMLRRILAQKGMQGEPTVAKCKIIRRELQAKRESAELDKSVIITEGGRTRRSRRNASMNTSYAEDSDDIKHVTPVVQPETLQTLSKIRKVIDSDSD